MKSIITSLVLLTSITVSMADTNLSGVPSNDPKELAGRVIDNLLSRGTMYYGDQGLHYAETCAAVGALRFAQKQNDTERLERIIARYEKLLEPGNDLISRHPHVDQFVTGALSLQIYMINGDKRHLELGLWFADQQWEKPREDGLTSQTRWWIDDMYMVGMLQIQAYRATKEMKYADRAALQLAAYLKKLQTDNGLFYHGPKFHYHWGRGNGWVAVSLAEVLSDLPADHKLQPEIMKAYRKMMASLLAYQSDNGMWRQLIDYEYAWAESSGTAMFAFAMSVGLNRGWLDASDYEPAVKQAVKALCAHVDRKGQLREICIGTGQQDDIEFYLNRPRTLGDFHGQAPFLWLVTETTELVALAQTKSPPNIVVIICDDLNDTIAGMGGHPQAKTPHIDRLIKGGVRFANAASNCPLCGPSRASLWSGLYPHASGFYGTGRPTDHWNENPVIGKTKSLFEHFTANGYRNFSTGKIHHNGHEVLSIFENEDGFPGFGSLPSFGPVPNNGKPENKKHGIAPPWWPEDWRKGSGWGDGFGPVEDLSSFGEGYGWTSFYHGKPWEYRNGHDRDPLPDEVHAAEAVGFLGKKHDKPFLLTVGFSRPHTPLYAPKKYFDLFPLESVELTPLLENDAADCAKILTEQHDLAHPWGWEKYDSIMKNGGEERLRAWTQAYLACVAFADDMIGQVLHALEDSPYAENTLVIFTSDHGYHMGEKDFLFKYSPWEESVRIPLVISGPGVAKNRQCTTPVSLIDLYPTCVDYSGLSAPGHTLDGVSLRPLLENPADGKWSGPSVSISACASKVPAERNVPAKADNQHFSVRSERHRYIRCRNGEEELYDHRNDPHEWTNLVSSPEHQEILKQMRKQLYKQVPLAE